ncbi:unnamed protein product, partial [Cyprideis torosa]
MLAESVENHSHGVAIYPATSSHTLARNPMLAESVENHSHRVDIYPATRFRIKVGYQSHTKKHSQIDKSVCALCDEPFRLVEDLEKHL